MAAKVEKLEEEAERHRHYTGFMHWVVKGVTIGTSVYFILALSQSFQRVGVFIPVLVHRSIAMALFLLVCFLLVPAYSGERRDRIPWYDVLIILLMLPAALYPTWNYDLFVAQQTSVQTTALQQIFGFSLVLIICEAVRRTIGWAMLALMIFFLAQLFTGRNWPGLLHAPPLSVSSIAFSLYAWTEGMFGQVLGVAATIIVAFVIFGAFLRESGGGKVFIDLGLALVGRFRGGPAKAAIVASGFFGMISGSTAANVATCGVFTIPLMKKAGYRAQFAAAVEAVASNGGQYMPPVMGAVAFIMASILNISYWAVCIAAFVPSLLYYLALIFIVDLEAVKYDLKGMPEEQVPSLSYALKRSWQVLIPLGVLIYFLAVLRYEAETAVLYALVVVFLSSFLTKENKLGPRRTLRALDQGTRGMIEVSVGCIGSDIIMAAVNQTGLAFRFSTVLTQMASENILPLLGMAALVSFILGLGMGAIPCYVILAVLVGPPLIQAGVPPIAAHLFLFWWGGLSHITPPVCPSAFIAAAIAGSNMQATGWQACRLGIISYLLGFVFVLHPQLLLIGRVPDIALAVVSAIIGAYFLAVGIEGIIIRTIPWHLRIVTLLAAVLFLWSGVWATIAAIVLALPVVITQWQYRKRLTPAAG